MRRVSIFSILVSLIILPRMATALPAVGDALSTVEVMRQDGNARQLPRGPLPLLIQYEDKEAQSQNRRAREELGRINRKPHNHERYEFVAVADVEKWDWWPAKKYVLDELKAAAQRNNTAIFADWTGALRKRWGLARGKSVILFVVDGKVRFAGEGTLAEAQLAALVSAMREAGADVD
jgi:hypothetical protein